MGRIITPDGKYALVKTRKPRCLWVFDIKTGTKKKVLVPRGCYFYCVMSDSQSVVIADHEQGVRITNILDCTSTVIIAHVPNASCLALSSDDAHIVIGTWLGALHVLRRSGESVMVVPQVHSEHVTCAAVTRNNKYIITGSTDRMVKVTHFCDGVLMRTITHESTPVEDLAITPDDQQVVIVSSVAFVHIVMIESGMLMHTLKTSFVQRLHVTNDYIVLRSFGEVVVWSFSNLQYPHRIFEDVYFNQVEMHPDGKRVFAASIEGTLCKWPICDWSDRDHHLFDPTFIKLVFLLMCIKARLERTSTQRRGLPRLPMAVWLVFFQWLHVIHK